MTKLYTVVCSDSNDYVNWQFELLEHTWSRIKQPGELVRLVAAEPGDVLPKARHATVIRTRPTNVHPTSGDVYLCYNRLYSLAEWLDTCEVDGTIQIIDPDVVFRAPVADDALPGSPVGQHWVDFALGGGFGEAIAAHSSVDIEQLQPVTWPARIHSDDLRNILPRWIALTMAIRERVKRQESDMFAFVAAAAEAELKFRLEPTSAFMPWSDAEVGQAPMIHYCQPVLDHGGNRIWFKQAYQPWSPVPLSRDPQLKYCRDLLALVDEFARIRRAEHTHQDATIFIAIAAYCDPELLDTIHSCLRNARAPHNLRFGICHQYDNADPLTSETCLDHFSQDSRIRYVTYPFEASEGGCWARNIAQQLYDGETYTLQIDCHTRMVESWDTILIDMLRSLPASKPLITAFPPLYFIEDGREIFSHIEDLSRVNTHIAERWSNTGNLLHTQTLLSGKPENPRHNRLLSGAFVFTLGEWNETVRQDPEHFYTAEEFALALRSYTHGFDLFEPSRIVAWHRCHPAPNRKYKTDHTDQETEARQRECIRRLRLLYEGDADDELGRYGLGQARTLDDYREFSGIDCVGQTVSDAAVRGGETGDPWPGLSTGLSSRSMNTDHQSSPHGTDNDLIDVTVHLSGKEPLLLCCTEDTPVLNTLFQGLRNRTSQPNDVIFLNVGEDGQEQVMFRQSELVSIETSPALGQAFLASLQTSGDLATLQTAAVYGAPVIDTPHLPSQPERIPDQWKIWIWHNVNRGCSKDGIFKHLIENGFSADQVAYELGYHPRTPLDQIQSIDQDANRESQYEPSPIAERLESTRLEIYAADQFLNAAECSSLIHHINTGLARSTVVGDQPVSEQRTSQTCQFTQSDESRQLAAEVTRRVCRLLGINPEYAEGTQGHVYGPGEEYQAHFDWFPPDSEAFRIEASDARGGQRSWSALVYLNTVEAGGETTFPEIDLSITPSPGKVVFWNNLEEDGTPNQHALHQACPVERGRKYILTLWFRSIGNGAMYQREPWERLPAFTHSGLYKTRVSEALRDMLATHYQSTVREGQTDEYVEGHYLQTNDDSVPSTLLDLTEELKERIVAEVMPLCEAWCGQPLQFEIVYGIRTYLPGASLRMHTDTHISHIISAILNVSQQVNRDWPLEIEDHQFRHQAIPLQPGELLLYEGARLPHGRPSPLDGGHYANIFVHFSPVGFESPLSGK